jgi:hypothetical protein
MKIPVAILFLFLLLLQAIPVLHFFSERNFYTYVDEDKPEETKLKIKKEIRECVFTAQVFAFTEKLSNPFSHNSCLALPSPYLESFTPPPNSAC